MADMPLSERLNASFFPFPREEALGAEASRDFLLLGRGMELVSEGRGSEREDPG